MNMSSREYKTRGWKEDEMQQVRHCECCNEPYLLADQLRRTPKTTLSWWLGLNTCGSSECSNQLRKDRAREQLPAFDDYSREEVVEQFHILREAMGLEPADTESSFDPWDVAFNLTNTKLGGLYAAKSPGKNTNRPQEYLDFCKFFYFTKEYYFRFVNRETNVQMDNVNKCNSFYFIGVFKTVFPEEWKTVPLWAMTGPSSKTLDSLFRYGIVEPTYWKTYHHWCYREWESYNTEWFNALFDKMLEEWYPNGVTYEDFAQMSGKYFINKKQSGSPWFPVNHFFNVTTPNLADGRPVIFPDSVWPFVSMFQRYVMRKEDGKFGKYIYDKLDYKVHAGVGDEMPLEECRTWWWRYVIPYYSIEIEDKENFPYNTPDEELMALVNVDSYSLSAWVPGIHKVTRQLGKKTTGSVSMESLIRLLWPDYEFNQELWSRQLVTEKKMNTMIQKALAYSGYDWRFSHSTKIPMGDGEYARYWDTNHHIKVDGICTDLRCIGEGQGNYHYEDDSESSFFYDGVNYSRKIPDSYLGEDRTHLGYRHDRDRHCRQAIEAAGFTPIYFVLSPNGYPVDGVHGDIPEWNRRYVSSTRKLRGGLRKRIGLAETFDMQGRSDIGDMIRKYYNEGVCG